MNVPLGKDQPDYFFVNADYSQVRIRSDDIIWIKGYGDYLKLHLKNTPNPLVVCTSFEDLDSELPASKFIRIHKSYAVSIDKITANRKTAFFWARRNFQLERHSANVSEN